LIGGIKVSYPKDGVERFTKIYGIDFMSKLIKFVELEKSKVVNEKGEKK